MMQTARGRMLPFSAPSQQQCGRTDHRQQINGQSNSVREFFGFGDIFNDESNVNKIVQMVSINNALVSSVYNELTKLFVAKQYAMLGNSEKYDLANTDIAATFAHATIKRLLQVVPLSANSLYLCIKDNHPHKTHNAVVQWVYVKHALIVTQYCPSLLEQILGLCIDKTIAIDVEISLDELPEELEDGQGGLQFEVELDGSQNNTKEDANKLDGMMTILFQYIDAMLGPSVQPAVLEQNPHIVFPKHSDVPTHPDHFFATFLRIFDRVVLNTHKSKYTQFLMFYACRLSAVGTSQAYSQRFIVHLLGKLLDSTTSKFVRIAVSAYLGSYTSRAAYLPINLVKDTLTVFMDWAVRYLNTLDSFSPATTLSSSLSKNKLKTSQHMQDTFIIDVEQHAVFYMVAQSLYYIFCFHYRALAKFSGVDSFAQGFQRVSESKLNPFKVCLPTVVREFSRIVSTQKGWFNSEIILQKNERVVIPTKTSFGGVNQLESFFPFDPYLLKHSSKYISDLYSEWAEDDEMDDSDDEDDTRSSLSTSEHSVSFRNSVGSAFGTPVHTPPLSARSAKKPISIPTSANNSFRENEDVMMSFTPEVEHDLRYHFSFD